MNFTTAARADTNVESATLRVLGRGHYLQNAEPFRQRRKAQGNPDNRCKNLQASRPAAPTTSGLRRCRTRRLPGPPVRQTPAPRVLPERPRQTGSSGPCQRSATRIRRGNRRNFHGDEPFYWRRQRFWEPGPIAAPHSVCPPVRVSRFGKTDFFGRTPPIAERRRPAESIKGYGKVFSPACRLLRPAFRAVVVGCRSAT